MTLVEETKSVKNKRILNKIVATESRPLPFITDNLVKGTVVVPVNNRRVYDAMFKYIGIGLGLRTKVNANIGTSPDQVSLDKEREKLLTSIAAGADTVMDLSTGGNINKIRRMILKESTIPVGTVPIYQVVCENVVRKKNIADLDEAHLFDVIEEHCADGVDFITVHCGVTRQIVKQLKTHKRVCGIVSRGGTFLAEWILRTGKENPLFAHFERLLDIVYKYDVTLSLGDGLRPGAGADANDLAQLGELSVLGDLVLAARKRKVQVMVEGPGHMPIHMVVDHIKLQKRVTHQAPFYLLGPLVTDVAPGYDHITSAIGGALAASVGADFLCYVTPAEHLRLPEVDDVHQGVIAARIAGHSGDIAKNVPGAIKWDKEFSIARKSLNWDRQTQLAIDPVKVLKERKKSIPTDKEVCTMCGQFCAMRESTRAGI